jgi:hypothetical protein
MSCTLELALRPKRTTIEVRLHEPLSTDDECPILQDQIATAQLENFPYPFLHNRPTHTAMTLKCNHTFHAMALVYHWARNCNVLCPVCRSGSKGQCLAMNRLPKEWKYSMTSRTRRERKRDREEDETHNRHLALQHTNSVMIPSMELEIRIEAQAGISPASWVLKTKLVELRNTVVFDVPLDELRKIPYPPGTFMRLVPYTNMHMLQPSNWFKTGMNPGNNFSAGSDAQGKFIHIHMTMPDDVFATLTADMIMGRLMGGGEAVHLYMLTNGDFY